MRRAVIFSIFIAAAGMAQTYQLPTDRSIQWVAGTDLWNSGAIPSRTAVTCSPLYGDGVTDDGARIQACINAASANTAVYLPAGSYYVNSIIVGKTNVSLRGAGAASTTITLGSSGWITTPNFSGSYLQPPTTYATHSDGYLLSGSPQKGDTTLTISTGTVSVNDWISVFSDDDPTLVNSTGELGNCGWCADNTGFHLLQQIVQVTAVNGSQITISRPLYYTLYTKPQYRKYPFQSQKVGFEDFKVVGGDFSHAIITLQGTVYSWVKGVETYNSGSYSGSAHVGLEYSYGCEVRDSYLHVGRSSASGSNYGVFFRWVNSDHKVENNIMRHNRHGVVYEGGGSGTAILYNYIDDNFTDDLTYLGSARTNHGAHPYMNLFEGNLISHITADGYWGTSSHVVFFRNWLWGDETGNGVPSFPPSYGYAAVDVYSLNPYYSFVGNVLGSTGMQANWAAATVRGANRSAPRTAPVVYSYEGASGSIPSTNTTSLNHGNYDYKTQGVAYWEGGSAHALASSLYYASKPSFFGSCTWPSLGPDVSPMTTNIPAKTRFDGSPCASAGNGAPPTAVKLTLR